MIELLHKRPDGTFVAQVYGLPYHVIESDEPLWSEAVERAADMGDDLGFEPPPPTIEVPPLTRLAKADLWRRLTDDEAEALNAVLVASPIRLRRIYEAATYIDTADADYPALHDGIVAALGSERAAEILTPNI